MGLIRKAASILTLGGVGNHGRRDPQAKAAKGQAALAEADTEVTKERRRNRQGLARGRGAPASRPRSLLKKVSI